VGYLQLLRDTYEKSRSLVGRLDDRGTILLPIAHSTQNAQIEAAIDLEGNFKGASVVEKAQSVTVIPVTEDSGSRSSGIAPHPLHDKLCYTAGDYAEFSKKKNAEEYYNAYVNQLARWVCAGCHPAASAVYRYVKKGTLIHDLIEAGVLICDEKGLLDESIRIEGISQPDVFVRFRILDDDYHGQGDIWNEIDLYEDYKRYHLSQIEKIDLDYITGEWLPCSDKQPSKIRNSADKAKLISANDNSGFTYRGRFANRQEALSLGYVSSQEAHNALRWLIQRQGYRKNGMCVVAWNPEDKAVPSPYDSIDLFFEEEDPEPDRLADVGEHYADEVVKAIRGRFAEIDNPQNAVVVMELDAATPGRLAVAYFRQMLGSDFLEKLLHWHTTCSWILTYPKRRHPFPVAPAPEDIVCAAFGVERNGLLDLDAQWMKATMHRLLPCIMDGKKIPSDIVHAALENASRPLAFSEYNRRKIQEVACALIHKKYCDEGKGRMISMYLDRTCDDRDYLYGRLLAVAHKAEYDTYDKDEKGKRETNAMRYMYAYSKRPQRFLTTIMENVGRYRKKLSPAQRVYYETEQQEIFSLLTQEAMAEKRKLGPLYLLGYNHELAYLWDKQKVMQKEEGGEENE
jgi:CRISPR-associated protein Csd1